MNLLDQCVFNTYSNFWIKEKFNLRKFSFKILRKQLNFFFELEILSNSVWHPYALYLKRLF